jgi:hypothetical protein
MRDKSDRISGLAPRKFKFIGCEIIYREVCLLAARSPDVIDVQFVRKGLHDLKTADILNQLQSMIDAVGDGYEAILLGYARCSNGTVGLTARRTPLVIPRAHDCISFFFGGRSSHKEYFDAHPGTYFHTTGWIERGANCASADESVLGQLGLDRSYAELVEKYDQEIRYNLACYECVLGNMGQAKLRLAEVFNPAQNQKRFDEWRLAALKVPDLEPLWGFLDELQI